LFLRDAALWRHLKVAQKEKTEKKRKKVKRSTEQNEELRIVEYRFYIQIAFASSLSRGSSWPSPLAPSFLRLLNKLIDLLCNQLCESHMHVMSCARQIQHAHIGATTQRAQLRGQETRHFDLHDDFRLPESAPMRHLSRSSQQ
jgi:hypothetical protein